MHNRSQSWALLLAVGLIAALFGCQREATTEKVTLPSRPKAAKRTDQTSSEHPTQSAPAQPREEGGQEPAANEGKTGAVAAATEKKAEPPQPATSHAVPKVALSKADEAASLINVGREMPDAELPDLAGKTQPLRSLFGAKLTVVVFWAAGDLPSLQELQDLGRDIAGPYGKEGVSVVAIGQRGSPEEIKAAAEKADARFPVLFDRDSALLAKVTTDKENLPRTYLLDPAGKVLWFDVKYSSRSTRTELLQAVRAVLGKSE